MQHFFGTLDFSRMEAFLDEGKAHHLLHVKRAEVGEEIEVVDGGKSAICRVESLFPLRISIEKLIQEGREPSIEMALAFGLLKGDHNELIVLKGTELGVSRFVPFLSERTVVFPKQKEDGKLLRLRKKSEEGAEQCRRLIVPEVDGYSRFADVLNIEADRKLFAYEEESLTGKSLFSLLPTIAPGSSVLVLIGPEGGFSEKEASLALEKGFEPVSLGKRILRAETAAIYAASLLCSVGE